MKFPKVFLRSKKAGAAIGRHPWVFAGLIGKMEGSPADGDQVAVCNGDTDEFIAYGLFNSKSEIRIRLYSWNRDEPINDAFFRKKIELAVRLRREALYLSDSESARRLVFSESDALSGLTVDQYGSYLVVQVTSLALAGRLSLFTQILKDVCSPKGIWLRCAPDVSQKEGIQLEDQLLYGEIPEGPIILSENGLKIGVHLRSGQKTGYFLDQHENRSAVARLAKGRRVLDLYCYTGGFSLQCARADAAEVIGIDSSTAAIEQARVHAERNELSNVTFVQSDVFEYLSNHSTEKFSLVIIDPPRLSSSREFKPNALRMYFRLNTEAIKLLIPEGILVSCSCSGRVSLSEWLSLLQSVARRSKRDLQILEVRGASRDHPVLSSCPESSYLKCVIARVI